MEKFDYLFIQPCDWGKSLSFFTETLEWSATNRFGEASDASRFANISYGEFKMVLAEDHDATDPAKKPAIYLTKGKVSIHFRSDDVDATFAKIKDISHIVVHPENTHWGTRWFVVEDPDGNQFAWQGPVKN